MGIASCYPHYTGFVTLYKNGSCYICFDRSSNVGRIKIIIGHFFNLYFQEKYLCTFDEFRGIGKINNKHQLLFICQKDGSNINDDSLLLNLPSLTPSCIIKNSNHDDEDVTSEILAEIATYWDQNRQTDPGSDTRHFFGIADDSSLLLQDFGLQSLVKRCSENNFIRLFDSKDKMLKYHNDLINDDIDGKSDFEWVDEISYENDKHTRNMKTWMTNVDKNQIWMIKCSSIINCSKKDLYEYIVVNIDKTCIEWNDVMRKCKILHKFDIDQLQLNDHDNGDFVCEIATIRSEGYTAADREDMFLRFHGIDANNNSYYEVSKGVDQNTICIDKSETKYVVRSLMHFCSKKIQDCESNPKQCKYTTIWHYDPMGLLTKTFSRKALAKMILSNLCHEHKKLAKKFG